MAAGGNKKRHSAQQKENYTAYARTMQWKKNRIRKLEKHVLRNPNDKNAEAAVERVQERTNPRHSRVSKGNVCKVVKPTFAAAPEVRSLTEQLRVLFGR